MEFESTGKILQSERQVKGVEKYLLLRGKRRAFFISGVV